MAVRGALIEYSGQFLGPIPNIVVFQFNPEQIARTIQIHPSGGTDSDRSQRAQIERNASAGPPTEQFTVKIELSAAEDLGSPGPFSGVTRTFGVGPQIAALEKMVYPAGGGGLLSMAIDAVGAALSGGASQAEKSIPPEALAKLLFIWGPTRVLPVKISSMRITEQEYDNTLSATKAEIELGLEVANVPASDDLIAIGALLYTRTVKEAQVVAQMARGIASLPDVLPF